MKKIHIIILMSLISCSNSSQNKQHTLIENWIKINAHDPGSYESVFFAPPDTITVGYEFTEQGTKIKLDIEFAQTEINSFKSKIVGNEYMIIASGGGDAKNKFLKIGNEYQEHIDSLNQLINKLNEEFKSKETTYNQNPEKYINIAHEFRGKNSYGALVKNSYVFRLDIEGSSILAVSNLKNGEIIKGSFSF